MTDIIYGLQGEDPRGSHYGFPYVGGRYVHNIPEKLIQRTSIFSLKLEMPVLSMNALQLLLSWLRAKQ